MRVGVVAGGDEQAAVGAEGERSGMVAALLPLLLKLQEQLFGGRVEVAVAEREPADVLPVEVGGGVLKIKMAVGGEVRIERQADEAILLGGRDGQFTDEPRLAGVGVEGEEPTAELDPVDGAIGGDRQFHRLREARDECRQFEAGRVEVWLHRERRHGQKRRGHRQPSPHPRRRAPPRWLSSPAHRLSPTFRLP